MGGAQPGQFEEVRARAGGEFSSEGQDRPGVEQVQPGHEAAGRQGGGRIGQEGGGDRGGKQESGNTTQGGIVMCVLRLISIGT